MKIVVLAEDDIIDGTLYVAGQRVRVPLDYDNVRHVISVDADEVGRRNEAKVTEILAEKEKRREEKERSKDEPPDEKEKPVKDKPNGR